MQLGLLEEVVDTKMGLHEEVADTKKDLHEEIVDTKKNLHKELDLRIQGTQVKIETTRCGLETKPTEVTGEFLHGLDITWHEFKTQLADVEAQAEHCSCRRTGTGVGAALLPKFNGSTSWAVF
jgi:hypothetical protein